MQIGGPSGEQGGHASGADRGKNAVVGLFNHMALFNHTTLVVLTASQLVQGHTNHCLSMPS
ncbi:hypothetical protein H5410_004035 [Solanum commersonii]|uniref:Uncharacterized protein n=1 Tax=Solanum commersonii TaxID=4109 RepID=A0A9J6B6H7_SOLCO|nr:hypothetical protein H5410_004035 [Solanum commersonii]